MTDDLDDEAKRIGLELKKTLQQVRKEHPQAVRFSKGDHLILTREMPAVIALALAAHKLQAITIARLEKRIAALEERNERRAEILREAIERGRDRQAVASETVADPASMLA